MSEKILFVDDEPNVLATYKRHLRKQFQLETATSGKQGLEAIDSRGPFAVIVADLRMPGMDGIQFLAEARERAPDSVLMMLTGYADVQTALKAVNEGVFFRFLIKPVQLETLVKALEAGIARYQLVTAERELLEKTLKGSIEVLTEILGMVNPAAFGRATRIKHYVSDIAVQLQLPDLWQLEMAAMLSQIGCITVPPDILDKMYAGESLTGDEQELFSSHPSVGSSLVANIPRLKPIARMIKAQQLPFKSYVVQQSLAQERGIDLGAQILKVALDLDQLVVGGLSPKAALDELHRRPDEYNPEVVTALSQAKGFTASFFIE